MTAKKPHLGQRLLVLWVDTVRRFALWVLLLSLASAGAGLFYAVGHIGINTSTKDMLSEELPFRQNDQALERAFPQLDQQILVVVEADTAEQADAWAGDIAAGLAERPESFSSVFYPEGDPFFRRQGLLYLPLEELEEVSDRLAGAQPLLAALSEDMSLRGLAGVFELLAGEADREALAELAPALEAMADTVASVAEGRPMPLSWQALLGGGPDGPESRRRLITVQPVLDFASLKLAGPAVEAIDAVVRELGLHDDPRVRIRVTGNSVMLQDELKSVRDGIGMVGVLSLILVTGLLAMGLRSLRLVLATVLTLGVGLCWTGFFASISVVELNLISVSCAVLFIGLSVDFGIHFALRVDEELGHGAEFATALRHAAGSVGGPLTLTAVAAAIGFFSFLPTTYRGLSELGLISGVGMFIALFANLTVLPALLALMPRRRARSLPRLKYGDQLRSFAERRAPVVAVGALALGGLAMATLPFAHFDDDPFNLRDPDSPSVATLIDIIDDPRVEPYDARILAPSTAEAAALAESLSGLPEVERAVTLQSFVPPDQDDKLALIEETAIFLAPVLAEGATVPPPGPEARRQAVADLEESLAALDEGAAGAAAARLRAALARLDGAPATLEALEQALLGQLPGRLEALGTALTAEPFGIEDLPAALVARKVAADGQSLVDVYPEGDLRDRDERVRFVDAVMAAAPEASGLPIIITEAGRAVIDAFLQAAGTAVLLITLLLIAMLRNVRDSLLVLAPLVLAAVLTVAATVVFAQPFNFANVIVLPLLFGLGVASGIHMVARNRAEGDVHLMHTSTPRAVLFSSLTTIGSFCALALSSHPGTASMGALLTIAIGLTMLTCLIVLPALFALAERGRLGPA